MMLTKPWCGSKNRRGGGKVWWRPGEPGCMGRLIGKMVAREERRASKCWCSMDCSWAGIGNITDHLLMGETILFQRLSLGVQGVLLIRNINQYLPTWNRILFYALYLCGPFEHSYVRFYDGRATLTSLLLTATVIHQSWPYSIDHEPFIYLVRVAPSDKRCATCRGNILRFY